MAEPKGKRNKTARSKNKQLNLDNFLKNGEDYIEAKLKEETEENLEWEYDHDAHNLGMSMEYENMRKINALYDKVVKQENTNDLPEIITTAGEKYKNISSIGYVFDLYPEFENDISDLEMLGLIINNKEKNKLETPYKRGFIFDYFKFISQEKKINWKPIELIFDEKNLRSALGSRCMITQGMEKWVKFKGIDKEKIEKKIFTADAKGT